MKQAYLFINDNGLKPYDDEASKFLSFLENGTYVSVSPDDSRSLWRHKKFFALLQKVSQHLPEHLSERYNTVEKILLEIKLQMGYYDVHLTLGEREVIIVKQSISFSKMGEKRFVEFVGQAKDIILKWFLKNISEEDFDKEFMSLMFD